jgi:hypothetical protein
MLQAQISLTVDQDGVNHFEVSFHWDWIAAFT